MPLKLLKSAKRMRQRRKKSDKRTKKRVMCSMKALACEEYNLKIDSAKILYGSWEFLYRLVRFAIGNLCWHHCQC